MNTQLYKALIPGLATSLLSCAVSTALAAENRGKPGFSLEEVVVTARKIEENLQDAPVSVSAFTGEGLERRQIIGTDDLDQVTPNLQFTNNAPLAGNNSSSQVFIRGIGQTDASATVDPGVGLYIDDVYMSQSVGGTMEFRDISGVQVLRGPQGTLFGRNTIGGAVLISTTEPGDEFGGTLRFGLGDDDMVEAFVGVDIPLSENLKSRFTIGKKVQDGYVKRIRSGEDLGDTDTLTTTGKFVWTPSDDLEIKFQYDYTENDENGAPLVFAASTESATLQRVASATAGCPGFVDVGPLPFVRDPSLQGLPDFLSLPAVPMIDDERCGNDFQNKGSSSNNGTHPVESSMENWGVSFHISYDLNEKLTFKSVTAYREIDWVGRRDADNTPLQILHTDYESEGEQLSQELQLLYATDQLKGVAGLYYSEEEVDDILTVGLSEPPYPAGRLDSDNNLIENDSWAVFTQWTYNVSDALSLTLGARYTEDTKGSTPDMFNYENPTVKYIPVQLYEETFNSLTGSANLSYRWNENLMTYLSFSQGFKGGGWNSHFNFLPAPGSLNEQLLDERHGFEEEEAETWEIGFKADLLDNTLRVNGAIFSTDYTDLQFTYRIFLAPTLFNAGEASIDGAELEFTYVPNESWIIEGGIGYLDDSIDKVSTVVGTNTGVTTDNTLPYTPEITANLGIGYILALDSGLVISPRVDFSYTDEQFFDAGNTEEIAQNDAETIVNLLVAIEPADERWKLLLGVNNATDELYPIAGNSSLTSGAGYAEVAYAREREYFVSFTYDF